MKKHIVAVCDPHLERDHPDAVDILQSTLTSIFDGSTRVLEWPFAAGSVGPDDLVVLCGKKCAEGFLQEKKLPILKRAGHVVTVHTDGVDIECVIQLSPAYVQKQQAMKGGASEKAVRLWFDVWEKIAQVVKGVATERPEVTIYETEKEVTGLLKWILKTNLDVLSFDYETWGDVHALRPELCNDFKVVSVGLAWHENGTGIGNASFLFDRPRRASPVVEDLWKQVLRSKTLVAHFSRYEHKVNFRRFGFSTPCRDTALQLHTLDELADLSLERVMVRNGLFWSDFKEQYDTTRTDPMHADVEDLLVYNGLDAHATLQCHDLQEVELDKEGLTHISRQNEAFNLDQARQEMIGIAVDPKVVSAELAKADREATALNVRFRALPEVKRTEQWALKNVKSYARETECAFNAKSTPMMHHLLLKEIGVPKEKLTIKDKGKEKITTRAEHIEKLADEYPVLALMNDFRSAKAMVTMLEKWDQYVGPDRCVHSQYNQTRVVTGRISSTDPPLQNIPKDNSVRRIFISRFGDDGTLIAADYKQQEPRLIAGWSGDRKMIDAIRNGLDLHAYVGAMIFDADYDWIVAENTAGRKTHEREVGKRMNLGIAYGQTEFGLSAKTGMSVDEARVMLQKYDERFPDISQWRLGLHRMAMELGYVTDLFGARRHLAGAQSTNKWERSRALRQAGNYPIQGTAYRFTQIAVGVAMEMYDAELPGDAFVVGQVHDSIIVDCRKSVIPEALGILREAMLVHNTAPYWGPRGMPMDIDITMGPNLYEMKRVKIKEAS